MSEPKGTYYGPDLTAELAATRARLAEAVQLLYLLQWVPEPEVSNSTCPWCLHYKRDGHEGSCGLAAFLARERAAQEKP